MKLSFKDVLIVPKYSEVHSRLSVDTSTNILGSKLHIPILSANMDCVTDYSMAEHMHKYGGMGIIHRFYKSKDERISDISKSISNNIGTISIGTNNNEKQFFNFIYDLYGDKIKRICVDVSHGHSKSVKEMVSEIFARNSKIEILAGNVCTYDGTKFLMDIGVSNVKVGIGPGSACTTRTTTGVGVPQFSAIEECVNARNNWIGSYVNIIADGGITGPDDLCKAIACGADAVMLGMLLAGCDESAAPIEIIRKNQPIYYNDNREIVCDKEATGYKIYRGQSSHEIQKDVGNYRSDVASEGESFRIPGNGPLKLTLDRLVGGLRSSMSYVGAFDIRKFHKNAEFIQISHNGYLEGKPHGKNT